MGFLFRVGFVAAVGLLLSLRQLATTHTVEPSAQNDVLRGNQLYYEGEHRRSLEAYADALKIDSGNLNARLNGAVVLNELGEHTVAAIWYGEAVRLDPQNPHSRTALAETLLTLGRTRQAREQLRETIQTDRNNVQGWTALGRLELEENRPKEAAVALLRATQLDPNDTLAHFYLGKARERLGDDEGALKAYREASAKDSYFSTARYQLSKTLFRLHRFHDAYDHASKLVSAAPVHANYRNLASALRERIRGRPRPSSPSNAARSSAPAKRALPLSPPPGGEVPSLRIGVGTTGMGKPIAWDGLSFSAKTSFEILAARSGSFLAKGQAGQRWEIRVSPKRYIEVFNHQGKKMLQTRNGIRLKPDTDAGGWIYFKELGNGKRPNARLARTLRGELELNRFPGKRALKVVNIVDLENYTQGVLTAEMPIGSPVEALKAQAVIARTHALFVKNVRRRHASDGYHLCDGQHCQVYYGVGSETEKSRAVVSATRGRVVTHQGRVAEMLYSSNCGGHSQSSRELKGWSPVEYFTGVRDAEPSVEIPSSPWELRLWLRGKPKTYCRSSQYVYSSHYRWSRVISAADLERRINRKLPIGTLLAIVPLKRSSSGHLNSILVRGSKGSRTVDTEMRIRGLFGIGSQRSALFVMDTEYDPSGYPQNFIFYGGGWGHGVGMCQSGAMGRAEQGEAYAKILKAYYSGIEIGNLRY